MTKQEEIRGGIKDLIAGAHLALCEADSRADTTAYGGQSEYPRIYNEQAIEFLKYLHSQGVVIEVKKELPENPYSSRGMIKSYQYSGYEKARKDMAGYVAVESLIKENKS